ncbi:MAG: hypothetical protein PWR28_770 [Synergistaceae bacterium]|jgi:hypothetical protein|nr:hypothetical protein [Synergistaceae bacterium]MDI3532425.1 hypothetical protein [Synergistaceae bacterium]
MAGERTILLDFIEPGVVYEDDRVFLSVYSALL